MLGVGWKELFQQEKSTLGPGRLGNLELDSFVIQRVTHFLRVAGDWPASACRMVVSSQGHRSHATAAWI
jgi:hypothetical protein